MKKLIFLVLLLAVAWVAWPLYSMYQIYGGLQSADASVLNNKIDFVTLRKNMRPTISHEVDGVIAKNAGGAGKLFGGQIGKLKGKIVDGALTKVVTAQGLAKVFKAGGDVTGPIKEMVMGQFGKLGGLSALAGGGSSSGGGGLGSLLGGLGGGEQAGLGGMLGGLAAKKGGSALGGLLGGGSKKTEAKTDDAAPAKPAKYGIGNLKRFAFTGLTSMEVGVAKDASVDGADVTAVMAFKDFDWKLVNIIPRQKK